MKISASLSAKRLAGLLSNLFSCLLVPGQHQQVFFKPKIGELLMRAVRSMQHGNNRCNYLEQGTVKIIPFF